MAVVKLVATLSSYGRKAVVVGGVADRYASELARAGQSNRRRAGTGSAAPQRATSPPLWPAGMAEGNRETFGPRVGLSSHGSPAKGGPKSKCLARVKIARTSVGLPSLTISDLSRFPLQNPLSASKCLARVKIARTSVGLPSLTISDLSRFPLFGPPVPLSAFAVPLSAFVTASQQRVLPFSDIVAGLAMTCRRRKNKVKERLNKGLSRRPRSALAQAPVAKR